MKKENKGITLIALVITIIVLLILAGVAIATLTGENGILTKANEAKTKTTEAGAYEQVEVAVAGSMGTDGQLNYTDLEKNLKNIDGIDESTVPSPITQENFPITVTVDGIDVEIKETGEVQLAFNAEEWDKTACNENCFIWESNNPSDGEKYHTIIGYADSICNEVKIRIPSRCHEIRCDVVNFDGKGRDFAKAYNDKIELPNTVLKIGNFAFAYFKAKSINIPNSVTSIGGTAFCGCTALTNITVPDSVTYIGEVAFCGCKNLTNITIPNSVTNIGYRAFDDTEWYNNQPDGLIYAGKVVYEYKGTMPSGTSIQISYGTRGIAGEAFCECENLTNITIPNSVMTIGQSAFIECTNLTNITIPNSVTSIGNWAFYECKNLTNITIPNSVTNIGIEAFGNKDDGPISDTAKFNVVKNSYADKWLKEHKYGNQTINYINE